MHLGHHYYTNRSSALSSLLANSITIDNFLPFFIRLLFFSFAILSTIQLVATALLSLKKENPLPNLDVLDAN